MRFACPGTREGLRDLLLDSGEVVAANRRGVLAHPPVLTVRPDRTAERAS